MKQFNIGVIVKSRLWRGFVAGFVGAVAACACPAAEAATNCVGAAPGLVEWWPGDGSANGIIAGNNGSLQGNSIASAPGVVGTAFSFDGTNGYVQISDSPTFDQATFTLAAWVQFKSLESQGSGGSPAGDQYLIFKQNSRNSSFEGYDLSKTRVSGGDRFRFLVASAAGVSLEIDGATLISTGVWYHVAAVRGSNYTQLYVNGQLDAQGTAGFAQDYGTLPLYFGTSGQTFWDHKLNGYLDEVSLYNRALSAAEIAAEYAAGSAGKCKGAAIVSLSPSQSAVLGTNLALAVNATGYGSLSYQWRFNNSNLAGATSSVLALNNVQATNAGSYTVVVASSLGSVTSSVIALTVLLPPTITTQPLSQTVNSGANAGFSVVAAGSAPLGYQWISNGSALPGATASSLILAGVQPANSGTYTVVVSNSVGAVTSAPAVLTVLVPPAITLQPQSVTNASGTTASFNAAASGSAPLSYQWRWNGSNLSSGGRVSGATTGTLSLSGVQPGDAGSYTLVVSNQAGSVTSAVAVLTVLSAPSIVVPPASLSAAIGSNADFTVTAAGSTPLNYQWQFNGTNLSGAVTTALSLVDLSLANAGSYAVVVSNTFGVITSAPGVLTVLAPPFITTQPQSDTNIPAATTSFSVGAGGSVPLGYRWRFNGSPLSDGGRIAGSATATLTIAGLLATDAGGYSVVVTNTVGSVTSQVASLTMLAPPTILTQPANATVMAGTTAGFGVSATGPGTLGFQWRLNGSPLAGATASSLAVSNAQGINAGSYQVIVTNLAGATTSAVATLAVLQPTACASPLSGLAGWWTGDGNANDLIAGNNGALLGGAMANGPGKVGAAFSFDGVNSYVQIPDAAALRPASLTIEAWVQFTGLDGPGSGTAPAGDQYIVFKQNSQSGDFEGYDLSKTRRSGSDVFRFLISSGAGQSVELDSATTIVPGVWYHVAAVRGSSTMQLYVNGQLEKQATIGFAQSYGALPLYFGTSGQSFWDRKFYGLLDEVSLYTRALTAQEIAAIYAAGADGKCKAPSIASQPQSQAIVAGGTASFDISATGLAPLGYQWQFNGAAIPGATGVNLTLANVQPSQAGAYSVLISNSVGFVQSAVAVLSVLAQPGIAAQPLSSTNLAGANVTLSVTATGMQPLSYQWLFNGASIAGASQNTLALPNVQTGAAGSYQVIVTNSAGAITSSIANLTVWEPAAITSQPLGSTNLPGTAATFFVNVAGTPTPGLQWYFNGSALDGATGATFTIPSVQLANAGTYVVVATNAAGSATSAPVLLTVWAAPAIATQPQSRTNLSGTDALFTVGAMGTSPLAYQWRLNGNPIPDGTNSALLLSSVQSTNEGSYSVVVANGAGAATSAVATLAVWVLPAFSVQPQSQTNSLGSTATLTAVANGTQPLGYQWRFNGGAVAGATGTNLSLDNVQLSDGGSYTVVATNIAGAATSTVAVLTVWASPAITGAPQSRTNLTGSDATFGVSATGTQPLRYQWLFNGNLMAGATAATVTLTNAQLAAAGSYAVVVTNVAGAITSPPATLTMWAAPALLAQPQSRTNLADSGAIFSVSATGTAPLSYQWLFNGLPLSGATASSNSLGSVQVTNAGSYAILVTNIAGSITSGTAVLTVWVPPSITVAPGDRTNLAGTATTFSVTAAGTQPLSYQWQLNSTNIPGATSQTLALNAITLSQAGNYRVIVTNVAGSVTSPRALLTVWMAPAITTHPKTVTGLAGSDAVFSVAAIGMEPLAYQWRLNGGAIPGATTNLLTLPAVQADVAGTYDVVITNLAGAVTSSPATLTVTIPAPYHPGAGAVILVNSHSGKYADFQHFIQPYLDNFGFPYVVQDISTNPPAGSLTNYAVIIIGHSQLDTNQVYLNAAAQTALSLAVSNGTGLVNFDNNLANNNSPRYQYIQDIFGFTYGSSTAASSVTIPPTEPGGKMQYISALHPTNDAITFRSSITMPGLTGPAGVTNIALSGGKPMVAIRKYGAGRALQWGSYDWMVSPVLGPLEGMDDLIWRGIVWAGRKPLVMRGMPNLVSFRIDDVSGPVWWGHVANEVGMKPYFAMFLNDISESTAADIRSMVTNGNATAAIHSFGDSSLFYFDHQHETAYSDTVQSNNFYTGTQWHLNHGIPISKVCATHYSEIGVNAFAGLKNWGMEFVPIEVVPGTVEYAAPYAPWVVAGPYRLYETPQQGQVNWPMLYADWLVIPGHPEMSNTFFNPYCEIRDVASCHEWCPDNDVPGTISRGTAILKRSLDSMAMATLFTHEWYFHPTPCCGSTTITTNNLRAEFQGITNNLAAYQPVYVTLDYASQYMRATRTAKLVSAEYDPGSGQVTATFTGKADLDLTVYTFLDDNGAVVPSTVEIPAFTNAITAIVASLPPQWVAPTISQGPTNQTVVQGSPVAFTVIASGTAPFSYQWSLNGTIVPGATHSALSLLSAQPTDAGSYQVTITNVAGAVTSAIATLDVLVPPTATVQSSNQMVISGSTVTLAADVTGTEPMAYQWRLDHTNIPGAQVENLVLTNISPGQAGGYDLYVTNMAGAATSAVVTLIVVVPPSFTRQPSNTLALVGSSVQFTAAATGSEPLTYQWLFNGTNVDGANSLTLNLANVQPSDAGGYSLLVSNAGGASNSAVARLTVATRPLLFAHPPTNGLFTLTLQGDAGLNYLIEATTNWSLWNSLSLVSNQTGLVDFTDPATNMPKRFYRARLSY